MVEGAQHFFKGFGIIINVKDKLAYVYKGDIFVTIMASLQDAQVYIMEIISGAKIKELHHPGVVVKTYLYKDKIYLISWLEKAFVENPGLKEASYESFNVGSFWNATPTWYADVTRYFHNEKGPSNICIDDGQGVYYWKGVKLEKSEWEKAAFGNEFNNKFEDWLNEV